MIVAHSPERVNTSDADLSKRYPPSARLCLALLAERVHRDGNRRQVRPAPDGDQRIRPRRSLLPSLRLL
jgi:hypothetical protein